MPDHAPPAGAVLVGVTDTPEARAAAAYAARYASDTQATVQVAHAYWVPTNPLDVAGHSMIGELETTAPTLVDAVAADLRQTYRAPVTTTVAAGKPPRVLNGLATTAATVVLGQDTATLFDRMTVGAGEQHRPDRNLGRPSSGNNAMSPAYARAVPSAASAASRRWRRYASASRCLT